MAINLMCMNSECRHYFEDNCMRNIAEQRLEIDEGGACKTFEKGINNAYKSIEMKVYFDGDGEWYASPWGIKKTKRWMIENYRLDDLELEECDLDNDCMWYETTDKKDIEELGNYDEQCKGGIGDLRRGIEDRNIVEKLMTFREVLKMQGGSKEPYEIATIY